MKSHALFASGVIVAALFTGLELSIASHAGQNAAATAADAKPFLGRWDLTLKAPDQEYPSWLEVQLADGQLKAQMVGRWGNARPLPKVEVSGDRITFVSPKEEESSTSDLVFQGKIKMVSEGELQHPALLGTVNGPDGQTWEWTGRLAPSFSNPYKTGKPNWGKPIHLFNGKDLTGWHESKAGPPDWTVKDGKLVTPGNGPEIISDQKFQDFKLHIEFNCGKDSNSGVYLRGRYETQIETESESEPPSHHTGGIYGFLAPTPEQPFPRWPRP